MKLSKAFDVQNDKKQTRDLTDPAQFAALPFIFNQPNLTEPLLAVLHKNEDEEADVFFEWFVKPGDHVSADQPIGMFHLLAPQIRRKELNPQIYPPADCVITFLIEADKILESENLFSYKRLHPTSEVQEFMKSSPDTAKICKLQRHPNNVFWNVFPAIYALKRPEDRTQSSAQIDKFIEDEKSKRLLAASLVAPFQDLTPGL